MIFVILQRKAESIFLAPLQLPRIRETEVSHCYTRRVMMLEHDTGCVVLLCVENVPARQREKGKEKRKPNHSAFYFSSHPTDSEGKTSAGVVGKRDVLPPHEELSVPVFGSQRIQDRMCKKRTLWHRTQTQPLCDRRMSASDVNEKKNENLRGSSRWTFRQTTSDKEPRVVGSRQEQTW